MKGLDGMPQISTLPKLTIGAMRSSFRFCRTKPIPIRAAPRGSAPVVSHWGLRRNGCPDTHPRHPRGGRTVSSFAMTGAKRAAA